MPPAESIQPPAVRCQRMAARCIAFRLTSQAATADTAIHAELELFWNCRDGHVDVDALSKRPAVSGAANAIIATDQEHQAARIPGADSGCFVPVRGLPRPTPQTTQRN